MRHSLPRKRDGEITNESRSCTRLDLRSGLACLVCRALGGWDCGQMTRSAVCGCMYLTLPPVQHHHKRYSTVYIHRHVWGCCAASGTHDTVPGTELPILYTNAAVEGSSNLARPRAVRRSHREGLTVGIVNPRWALSRSRCCDESAIGCLCRLIGPVDRTRGARGRGVEFDDR